ncbi:hypothetical protein NW801_21880 [Brevibacillus laterosporus]|uniref:Uncharacterized protein n=1 Tax=Brevibacillus halotolerans TaxID=1507437 RepID=A0ABT4I2U8_9BACL|nr:MULTISPECIES: hypothetical protein [Brevibacillus]MCR8987642.1 hypothetical protein [Brevibacillus laterosporus]MCZ0833381.1 hypothetical protein [Brevibacillus halotolerans]
MGKIITAILIFTCCVAGVRYFIYGDTWNNMKSKNKEQKEMVDTTTVPTAFNTKTQVTYSLV